MARDYTKYTVEDLEENLNKLFSNKWFSDLFNFLKVNI